MKNSLTAISQKLLRVRKLYKTIFPSLLDISDQPIFDFFRENRLFQQPRDLSTSLTKSASSRVFSSGFISFAHTPAAAQSRLFLGECCAAILEFLSLSNLTSSVRVTSSSRFVHQTSLRSRPTMMMYSNSPQSGEAGSLFS